MALGPFHVGQTPLDPALITITQPDGTARDLTGYTPLGVLYLPDGSEGIDCDTSINDVETGIVQVEWPIPSEFTVAGTYLLQVELTTDDPDILDFTTSVEVDVMAELPTAEPLVPTSDIFTITNESVSATDSLQAQELIGTFLGVDLATDWPDLTDRSIYWLTRAIAHQAAWDGGGNGQQRPIGVRSLKTGDAAIMYSDTSATAALLAPMAAVALGRIAAKSIYARPFIGDPERIPLRPLWEPMNI
jgi:hypothetical protein